MEILPVMRVTPPKSSTVFVKEVGFSSTEFKLKSIVLEEEQHDKHPGLTTSLPGKLAHFQNVTESPPEISISQSRLFSYK